MDGGRASWEKLLPIEVAFWDAVVSGVHSRADFVADFRKRAAGKYPFPAHLQKFIGDADLENYRILDVGAGPHTVIGPLYKARRLNITAVDPLASQYNEIIAKHGVSVSIPTMLGEAERLCPGLFERDTFDLVYSRNALDHSYNPWIAVQQMVDVCKPGGVVFFEGHVNEAVRQKSQGLHQWNFMPVSGDLVIWNSEGAALASQKLTSISRLTAEGARWFKCTIVKTSHV